MDKEQNSNKDENDTDNEIDNLEKAVIIFYFIPFFIGSVVLATIWLTIGFKKFDTFLGLCVYNGIAISFIVLIFIVSFIKFTAIYCESIQVGFFFICLTWITCFLAAISIMIYYGNHNISKNIFSEFLFIFFTFIEFSVIADIIVAYCSAS